MNCTPCLGAEGQAAWLGEPAGSLFPVTVIQWVCLTELVFAHPLNWEDNLCYLVGVRLK